MSYGAHTDMQAAMECTNAGGGGSIPPAALAHPICGALPHRPVWGVLHLTANADITLLIPRYDAAQRQDVYTAVTVQGVWMHAVHKGGDNPGDELRVRIPIDAGFGGAHTAPPPSGRRWTTTPRPHTGHWPRAGTCWPGRTSCGPPISPRALMEQYGKVWKITEAADNRNGTAAVQHWRAKAV